MRSASSTDWIRVLTRGAIARALVACGLLACGLLACGLLACGLIACGLTACALAGCKDADSPAEDEGTPEPEALGTGPCAKDLKLAHGPLLGAVTDKSIKIWARGKRPGLFAIECRREGEPAFASCAPNTALDKARDNTGTATLDSLHPDTRYEYRVRAWTEMSPVECVEDIEAESTFRTLPARGQPGRFRFVTAADVTGADVPGFAAIEAATPSFVIMLGDNVYADADGGGWKSYRRRYHEVWGSKQFRSLFAKVPVFMTWDDHEIMENYWKGKDDEIYAFARQLFDDYQGQHNPPPLAPGELYYVFHAGDVAFFVLDTRTHRAPNFGVSDVSKSMLGTEQRAALERFLTEDKSRVHVIISSVLMSSFSSTGRDSWRSFKGERGAILDVLARAGTANSFVVSGDQHWSAVIKMTHTPKDGSAEPYLIYEFQTTPLGSGDRDPPADPDATVVTLDTGHLVFGVFDIDTTVEPIAIDFTLCDVRRGCKPQRERAASSVRTRPPYTLRFTGGARGLQAREEL